MELVGGPGRKSGLVLRIGQCVCCCFSRGYGICFWILHRYCLPVLWSFGLACLDIHTLRFNKDLYHHIIVSLFLVGDWVTATLSLAAACSSAGVMVLFARDKNFCSPQNDCSCGMFQISIGFAFAAWFLVALSSHITFWLLASI